jgi:putative restriction endonuclease
MSSHIQAFVAVTDNDWHTFLRSRGELDEVNFWRPTATTPTRLPVGTPWFFKAKAPVNAIVGGGFFAHYSSMPISVAWDAFGEKNGAHDFRTFEKALLRLRREPAGGDPLARQNPIIGCVILSSPFFLEPADYVRVPDDWRDQIVSGKTYDLTTSAGAELWAAVQGRLAAGLALGGRPPPPPFSPAVGAPRIMIPRLGQGGFRFAVVDAYAKRCAVTGERTLPAIEAAHIRPFSAVQRHEITNGIALRSDIHRLFDQGYVTIDADYRFRVSRAIRDEFENGRDYYALHERSIRLPERQNDHPDQQSLEWHGATLYRGD